MTKAFAMDPSSFEANPAPPSRLPILTKHKNNTPKMLQLLEGYHIKLRDPQNLGDLYAELSSLVSTLNKDEIESIEYWLEHDGSSLPYPQPRRNAHIPNPPAHARKRAAEVIDLDEYEQDNKKGILTGGAFDVEAWTPRTAECTICMETLPRSVFPHSGITKLCKHETDICYACMQQNVAAYIQAGAQNDLECPNCPEIVSYEDMKVFATEEDFER